MKLTSLVFINIWTLILCSVLFRVFNIWGLIYPLLRFFYEIKFNFSNRSSKLVNWLFKIIFWLSFFSMLILLPRILWRYIEQFPYFHINDYYCTVDGICDDKLKIYYLWNVVYANFVVVIDFIWIRPKVHKFYNKARL